MRIDFPLLSRFDPVLGNEAIDPAGFQCKTATPSRYLAESGVNFSSASS